MVVNSLHMVVVNHVSEHLVKTTGTQ